MGNVRSVRQDTNARRSGADAVAQIEPGFTGLGTELVVHDNGEHRAVVVQMPFYDPLRLRTHPAH
jgi:glycine cleavage system aminomethyltransferase T